MVVLSAAVCSNSGKPLLARQFKEISKDSITAYLTNFSGLLLENNSQHTTIENGLIRYIYQPVENFILLLITNLNSNIIQDIDTLQVFSKTISSILRTSSNNIVDINNEIFINSFEILNAFDEIISQGYKENLNPTQVNSFLEMNSHEEKLQEIIDKNKELEVAEERKRKVKEIHRRELERRANEISSGFTQNQNVGGFKPIQQSYNNSGYNDNSNSTPTDEVDPTTSYANAGKYTSSLRSTGGGLQLGKKKLGNTSDFSPLLTKTNHYQQPIEEEPEMVIGSTMVKPTVPEIDNEGILIVINEKISAEILRDGSIKSSEIKGDLQLRINDPSLSHSKLLLSSKLNKSLQFKTHPNVDKAKFNTNIITLKDQNKSFPSNDQALGVLRWRGITKDEDSKYLPIVFSIWTSENNGNLNVTIEYELQDIFINNDIAINNLEIIIPDINYPSYLKSEDDENISFNVIDNETLKFEIKEISSENSNGAIDFVVETNEEDYLFPMYVNFAIQNDKSVNFANINVEKIINIGNDEELNYKFVSNILSDNFTIV